MKPFRLVKSDGRVPFKKIFTDTGAAKRFVSKHKREAGLRIGDHLFGLDAKCVTDGNYDGKLDENAAIAVLRVGENGIYIDRQP
ncbi:MAG: hypothetical protein V1668_04100 [Patescibacteria group bacterium]